MVEQFECERDGVRGADDGLVLHLERILPAPRAAVYLALGRSGETRDVVGPPRLHCA
jgi:hypothetical protein